MKRWKHWLVGLLAGALLLLGVAVAFILFAVHHLDAPYFKPRLQRWISTVAGFEVDWRSIQVNLGSGVHLEGLEVKSPPAFRAQAPDLLRADTVDVVASIFAGLRAIRITHADVTLIRDDTRGSWQAAGAPPATAAASGLSLTLAKLFSKPPPIPFASLDGGSLTWINVAPGTPVERVRVEGLGFSLRGWVVTLAEAGAPLHLDVKYERGTSVHKALLEVHGSARADRRSLLAQLELRVAQQDWAPNLSVGKLLSLRLAGKIDPAHQRIDLDLDHGQLFDEAVTLRGGATLFDDPATFPTVHDMDGTVDLGRVFRFLAPLKFPLSVDRGTLHFHAKNEDAIDIEANTDAIAFANSTTTASLVGGALTATVRPHGSSFFQAKVSGNCTLGATGAKPWFKEHIRMSLQAEDVAKDFSRARLRVAAAGQWGELVVTDEHHAQVEAGHITFRLPSLAPLRPLLAKMPWTVDWNRASAAGTVDFRSQFGSERPEIHQTSEIALENLAARLPAGPLAIRSLSVKTRSEGTDRNHHAEIGLLLAGLRWRDGTPSDQTLNTTLDFAAAIPRFHLALQTDGALAPSLSADVEMRLDRSRRDLVAEFRARAGHLSPLGVLLKNASLAPRLDLAKVEAALSGRAHLQGVFSGVDGKGVPQLEQRPLTRLRGDAKLEGAVQNLRWFAGDQLATIPSLQFEGTAAGDTQQTKVQGRLDIHEVEYAHDEDTYRATPLSLRFSTTLKPHTREATAQCELNVGQVLVGGGFGYPLERLKLSLSMERQRDGVIHVPSGTFENAAAGTRLDLKGGLALQETPAKLYAEGSLTQDLSKVWRDSKVFSGQGRVNLRFAVESSGLTIFHTSATLTLDRLSLRVPSLGLIAEGVDSEIPVVWAFRRTPHGIKAVTGRRLNAYSALRFADQHPLFRRRSYLAIQRLVMPQLTIESFAGNLKVDHNLIALDQMEMSVRGGRLAGQCLIDTDPQSLLARAELRATGVLSSHGEPFDGNAALSVSLRDRSIDGRAEILRIGRRHLLDLLDLQDPQHTVPAFNRIRRALTFGYPDRVKITFDRGFANVHISLGGLASLVRIDDLRGIPLEPLIDKYVKEEP